MLPSPTSKAATAPVTAVAADNLGPGVQASISHRWDDPAIRLG